MNLTFESFNDELDMLRWDPLDCLLDNVISVLIFNAFEDFWLQLLYELGLLVCKDMFQRLDELVLAVDSKSNNKYLLNNTTAIHLYRKFINVVTHLLG